jgi:hypothetical protein
MLQEREWCYTVYTLQDCATLGYRPMTSIHYSLVASMLFRFLPFFLPCSLEHIMQLSIVSFVHMRHCDMNGQSLSSFAMQISVRPQKE